MKARPLWLLLLLVFSVHWAGLSWLHQQVQVLQPLVPMVEPLFTRILLPQPQAIPKLTGMASRITKPAKVTADIETEAEAQGETPVAAPVEQTASPTPDETPTPAALENNEPASAQAQPAPDSWPADTRLSYQLTGYYRGPLYGGARVQWQREQSRYQVRVELNLALVIRVAMISQGEVTDAGLLPAAYEEQYPTSLQRMAFENGYVRYPNGLQQPQPQGLQDTASQFVELTHRFSSGRETLKLGAEVRVWLARPQGMALWTYDVIEEETLQIAELGLVQAFHLRPRPIINPNGAITAEIWFAPSLQYLPVRIRIGLGSGNFVDLLAERIEQGSAPPALQP